MSGRSLSLTRLKEEYSELQKDRRAFMAAYDVLRARVRESAESSRAWPPLYKWSGTRASIGSLELSIQHIDRCLEEHSNAISMVRSGEIENSDDGTVLGVIQGGDHEL